MPDFEVRLLRESDIVGAVSLQRACFPAPFPEELLWTAEHLRTHLEKFPAGQFVAIAEGAVVGSASNCIISEENWLAHRSWDETVGGPFIENHNPNGTTLYGLDISVHPSWRGRRVMRALYEARFAVIREQRTGCRDQERENLNPAPCPLSPDNSPLTPANSTLSPEPCTLTRYGTAVRIPGYDSYQLENPGVTPEDYVQAVARGEATDRTLSPMLRVGLKLKSVIKNYMEDFESHNAAAVLEWLP